MLAVTMTAWASAQAAPVSGLPDINLRDNVTRTVLDNGLTLLVVEDRHTDIVGVEMVFRVGQSNEDDASAGITRLIQNILVKRMEKAQGPNTNLFELRGSLLNATASPDFAEISLMTDTKNLGELLGVVARSVAKRQFTDDEVTDERRKMVELLESDQRVFKAIYEIFLQIFYRYHPYKQPHDGHAASVRQLTRERLEKYYARFWAPNKTVVAVVGNVDRDAVLETVKREMGAMSRVEDKRLEVSWEPKAVERELYLTSGSNLAWILLGFPAPGLKSPDQAPMRILSSILGEGLSSRLWVELREKRGFAYEVSAMYPELEGPSHMIDYTITTPDHVNEVQSRIFKEIERIKTTPVSQEELDGAKRRLIGQYLLERETSKGRALNLAVQELLGSGYHADLLTVDRLKKVTREDVLRVARIYLTDYTLLVARPRGYSPPLFR